MSEEPPSRDSIGGTIGGQKFALETQHLISVLLIIVVAGAMYFQIQNTSNLLEQMQKSTNEKVQVLHNEHEQMFDRMRLIGNALRVVDWNQNRPISDRVPIDLPVATFENYRQQSADEDTRRRTPRPARDPQPRRDDANPQPP